MADETPQQENPEAPTEGEEKKEAVSSVKKKIDFPVIKLKENPLISILLIANFFIMIFILNMQINKLDQNVNQGSDLNALPTQTQQEKPENLFDGIPEITANLARVSGPRRYATLKVVFSITDESESAELISKGPRIRDLITSIINEKRPEYVLAANGKSFLKSEIKTKTNRLLKNSEIITVYFHKFTVN